MDVDTPKASTSTSPLGYLEQSEASSPAELRPIWTKIRISYEKKLWHNVTVALTELLARPESGPYQIELFDKFIKTIEGKINALKLVEIARRVGREYTEPELTLTFLQSVHSRLQSPYPVPPTETTPGTPTPPHPIPSAYALSLSSISYAQLLLGDLPACKKSLDECESLLTTIDSVEPIVNAGYYGVAGDYYKVKADYGPYYKNALLYLACVDFEGELLGGEEGRARAHDLCVAALLGETIYNFGELLQHPILQTLMGTEYEWIKDLIVAFNHGKIDVLDSLSGNFANEPILQSSAAFLRQKICLMALIEAAFAYRRDNYSRLMSFQTIAQATQLPVHEVEHLVMKALSLKLIKGTLDQVASTVDITWIQPRVLDDDQLAYTIQQFESWTNEVQSTTRQVDEQKSLATEVVSGA